MADFTNVINALAVKHGLSYSAGYEPYLCFMDCQVLPGATSSSTMFFQRTVPLKSKKKMTNKKKYMYSKLYFILENPPFSSRY